MKKTNTIPSVIKKLRETNNYKEMLQNENDLACMFASPLMFLAGILNFIVRYLIWNENKSEVILDSLIFLFFGIAFEILLRKNFTIYFSDIAISLLYSMWHIFIVFNYFSYIGGAVLLLGFLQIMIAMTRTTRKMTVMVIISMIISSGYRVYETGNLQLYSEGYQTYIQGFLFFLILVVILLVHNLNINKHKVIMNNLNRLLIQKKELDELYKEKSLNEEKISKQNEVLYESNKELIKKEEKLLHLAHYDTLTELPNRKMIFERLNLLIDFVKDKDKYKDNVFYVVFIDLDHFKRINDTLGHDFGDAVIKKIAKIFLSCIDEKDIIGRLGGDEFALIIQRNLKEEDVFEYVQKMKDKICKPFTITDVIINISASFGISVYPQDGIYAQELLKAADTAMYKAKEIGKDCIQFYKKEMKDEILRKMEVEREILPAFDKHEFYLVFQPQYSIPDKKIRGLETLLRWDSKNLGSIPPDQFIPIVEDMGFINTLGEWILKGGCIFFKKLIDEYEIEGNLAVNISTVQLNHDNFLDVLKKVLKETGLQSSRLELEITESLFIKDFDKAIIKLNEIKELGVKIALDDFGTGFSSLSYMRRLPIDTLKIDKSFLDDILLLNLSEKNIVRDIIAMGHSLKTKVVAEGVEHQEQMDYLEYYGCDYVQGFLMSKPMKEEGILNVMKQYINK